MTAVTLSFSGKARYYSDLSESNHRLLVGVRCQVGSRPTSIPALLDTGSQRCELRADFARALGYDSTPDPDVPRLDTRLGQFRGRMERIPVVFEAEEGDALEVEATWFVADGWLGPVVIGWKGYLERLRFALDPGQDTFYFAGF